MPDTEMFRCKWTWLRDGISPPAGWGTEERLYKEIKMCYRFIHQPRMNLMLTIVKI